MNALAFARRRAWRWFGFIEASRSYFRTTWLEVAFARRPGLALALCKFSDDDDGGRFSLHVHLGWPNIFLRLPFLKGSEPHEMMSSWGASLDRDSYSSIHLNWGDRCKIVHLPWDRDWHRTSYLLKDATWAHDVRTDKHPDGFKRYEHYRQIREERGWSEAYPYTYTLRSGEMQNRIATVSVEEREWRQRWLRWTGLFAMVRRTISVDFDGEVGERSGSWKGGTMGCGYTLNPGEAPLDCLRRMERERTFR